MRRNAPASRLIVDANEGWDEAALPAMFAACAEHGVELIEQPLPAGRDAALARSGVRLRSAPMNRSTWHRT